MISKVELDELYRADDEARAERAEWLARREAQTRPFVRKSDDPADLTCANEPAPAAADEAVPLLSEALIDAGGRVIADLRREWSRELEVMAAQSRENRDQIAELRGKLDTLLAMVIGKSNNLLDSKSADVIPNWRKHVA
jgi:hypothetical protein